MVNYTLKTHFRNKNLKNCESKAFSEETIYIL